MNVEGAGGLGNQYQDLDHPDPGAALFSLCLSEVMWLLVLFFQHTCPPFSFRQLPVLAYFEYGSIVPSTLTLQGYL